MSLFSSIISGSGVARGASRVFTIQELQRVGNSLQPSGEEFKFTNANFAAPRGALTYAIQLRTVRRDLPGAEEPVEQVLGWNYTPFQVTGVLDDRYGGAGFAEDIRTRFEDMIKRGRSVRITTETLTFEGLITNLQITRQRKDRQGYQFTMSPHQRYKGESARVDASPSRRVISDPRTSVQKARRALEAVQAEQSRARAANASRVQQALATDIFRELEGDISSLSESIRSAEDTVENEILVAQDAANALNRGAQTMASVKTGVSTLLTRARGVSATTAMALESIVETLQYESWKRGVCAAASRLAITSDVAHRDFELRAQPKPKRLHRVRPGETLYAISNLYYGTPHQWRVIAAANHLSSIILAGGELLTIPEVS